MNKIYKIRYVLEDIAVFIYVAQFKSFARAADFLGFSRSVVSSTIAKLEASLELTLFTRTTRVVNLTNDGEVLFKYCSMLMAQLNAFNDLMQYIHGTNGALRITMPLCFGKSYIVPYLSGFLSSHPGLKLEILLTEDPVDILEEGYDLQICAQSPQGEDLEITKLMTNHKVVCAAAQYLEQYGIPTHPKDLLKHNCLIFGENTVWKFRHKITQEIIELRDIQGNIRCNNSEIIKGLLLLNYGITLSSIGDIEDEIKTGKVVCLFPEYNVINEATFYAVYPKAHNIPERVKVFVKFFQKKFEQHLIDETTV